MDWDFFKNLIDVVKVIQVMEYVYNKIKQGNRWVIENWSSVEKKIYSKTVKNGLILFFSIGFSSLIVLNFCDFALAILAVKATITTFWLAIGKFVFLTSLGAIYFLYYYKAYSRDRKVYLDR